jgi:hypothetical protein
MLIIIIIAVIIIITIMSMGWYYVSELGPPTGILFTSQVIYPHAEPWWNDIDRVKLIHPLELSGSPTSSYIVAKQEDLAKKMNFALQSIFFILRRVLQHVVKSCNMAPTFWTKTYCRFLSPLKIHRLRPGLGTMASTLTTRPPRTARFIQLTGLNMLLGSICLR